MSHRRTPLSSLPNAANSPYRTVTAAASKRSREEAGLQENSVNDQQRSVKRQLLESRTSNFRTPPRKPASQSGADDGVFGKKAANRKPTDFDRKLLAVQQPQGVEKQEKAPQRTNVEEWQKHYRKAFPLYVFYFENVSEEARLECSRVIRALGAREEKFFSRDVTHIITTRDVPSGSDNSPTELETSSSKATSSQTNRQPRTINPSLLDRHPEPTTQRQPGNRLLLDSNAGAKSNATQRNVVDLQQKKTSSGNADVLQKAYAMGMKIWQVEKLQRILITILEGAKGSQTQHGRSTRKVSQLVGGKATRDADLSYLLRNEQQYGPSDRDQTVFTEELVPFRGYYLYIRDMDEKTKPILLKEYAKPSHPEDADWPRFHANSPGKCPFIEDHTGTRHEMERVNERIKQDRAKARAAPRTRAETATQKVKAPTLPFSPQRKPLAESKNLMNKASTTIQDLPAREFCPPPAPVRTTSENSVSTAKSIAAPSAIRFFGGEPAASGLQPSNVTSAIRSQVISSTAAAPGAKASTSKEFHGLKRKVLEKNTAPAWHGMQAHPKQGLITVPARAEQAIPVTRQSRKKAQEKLVNIEEESDPEDFDEEQYKREEAKRALKIKETKKSNLKPGYCENCRDRYDDFDEHIVSRKHRKFALSREPWAGLDKLLSKLGRPLKEEGCSVEELGAFEEVDEGGP